MPFGGYKDWEDCTSKNSDKDNPEAYCGYIKHKTEDIIPPGCLVKAYNFYMEKFPHLSKREILDKSFNHFKGKKDFTEEPQSLNLILDSIGQEYDLLIEDFLTTDQVPGSRIPEGGTRLQRQQQLLQQYEQSYQTPEAQAMREGMGGSLIPPLESITRPFSLMNTETGAIIRGEVNENLRKNLKELTPVSSSNVRGVGQFRNELLVQFHSKGLTPQRTYRYQMETPEMAEEAYRSLASSGSPGRWVWQNIRGHTAGEEVTKSKLGPSLSPPGKGYPVIGGTTASLAEYSISNRVPVDRVEKFEQMSKQLKRETSNPQLNPNTGSRVERLLKEREASRNIGLKHQEIARQVRQLPKIDFKVITLNTNDLELTEDIFNDLKDWVLAKKLTTDPEEAKQIAFAIIKSRKKKGKDKGKDKDWEESWNEIGESFQKQRLERKRQEAEKKYNVVILNEEEYAIANFGNEGTRGDNWITYVKKRLESIEKNAPSILKQIEELQKEYNDLPEKGRVNLGGKGIELLNRIHRLKNELGYSDFTEDVKNWKGEEGNWITIKGRHVFIKEGQSLEEALKFLEQPKTKEITLVSEEGVQKWTPEEWAKWESEHNARVKLAEIGKNINPGSSMTESQKEAYQTHLDFEFHTVRNSKIMHDFSEKIIVSRAISVDDLKGDELFRLWDIDDIFKSLPKHIQDSVSELRVFPRAYEDPIWGNISEKDKNVAGFWQPWRKSITIKMYGWFHGYKSEWNIVEKRPWIEEILTHEGAHALDYIKLNSKEHNQLEKLFEKYKKKLTRHYAGKNRDEFFAEIYTYNLLTRRSKEKRDDPRLWEKAEDINQFINSIVDKYDFLEEIIA